MHLDHAAVGQAPRLRVRRLGRVGYAAALALQERLVEERVASQEAGGDLLLLEHDPVYTMGRGADEADLMGAPARLGVPVFRISRGGGVTFHGPGQIVAYPIVRMAGGGRDVYGHIRRLEAALLDTCLGLGVVASVPEGETGVWVGAAKVGSIGIGVRRSVSFHGVSLNVNNRIDYFEQIVTCRVPGMPVTTLERAVGGPLDRSDVEGRLAAALARALELPLEEAR